MKKISWLLSISVALFGFFQPSFAGEIPFTDIRTTDPYYYPVRDLFEGGIITDNGDRLFRPNDLMSRDFFVSLAVEIGCHECETPNIDDIIKYQISPFIDLSKNNNYYYCIAYAADNKITQGYTPNEQNKAYCENKQEYASSPFCAENTISRIEATAILLRRAKLWDDTMNQGVIDRTLSIPDTTVYWYGYAKKGIELGMLVPKANGSIGQDEKITRGEFAIMAAKMLQYTQCSNTSDNNSIESSILLLDSGKNNTNKSTFSLGEDFSLVALTSTGNWNYNWTLKNPITGEVITMTGNSVSGSKIPEGTWVATLQITDPISKATVSESRTTITIGTKNNYTGDIGIKDGNGNLSDKNTFSNKETITLVSTHTGGPWNHSWEAIDEKTGKIVTGEGKDLPGSKLGEGNWTIKLITKDPKTGNTVDTDTRQIRITDGATTPNQNNTLSIHLSATPIVVNLGEVIKFNTNTNSTGGLVYKWNFGDGNTNTSSGGSNNHNYTTPGTYPVTVTVTDPKTGNTAQSTVIIRVTGNTDTDGDGIFDNDDSCPYIFAKTTNGCPIVNTYNPGNNGNNTNPSTNSSNPGNGFVAAQIGVRGSSGQIINSSNFNAGDVFNLVPVTNTGTWDYAWQAINPVTGQVINGTGGILPGSVLGTGDWKITLNVIDPKTSTIVASPTLTIRIGNISSSGSGNTSDIPCVTLIANPLSTTINTPIDFTSNICPSTNPLVYNWDYGDGSTFPTSSNTNHTYTLPGVYTVILKVTDPITGKTGESKVLINITGTASYSDGLGISNNICLMNQRKNQGLLIGKPNCTQCPCNNSIEINSLIRSCDVVFPTVLSPTLNTIYTRGGFFLIP